MQPQFYFPGREAEQPGGRMHRHQRQANRGIAVILVTLLLIVIIPLIGLAIDGGTIYFLKGQLQQAVDGAALSGARSLSSGLTLNEQISSATNASTQYFKANYGANYWGSSVTNLNTNIYDDPNSAQVHLVDVTATASAPLYFLRLLGKTTAVIGASAEAKRRDVNVMMVLDRSSSMGSSIKPMVQGATLFANSFAPGRDTVGAVIFGGNYYIYPPTKDFQPSLVTALNKVTSSGNTGTAQALWQAYSALAGLNQPGALNVILFFTDGLPNGITVDLSKQPSGLDNRRSPTTCGTGASMIGWISQTSGFVNDPGTTHGIYSATVANPSNPSDPNDGANSELIANRVGCNFAGNPSNMYKDFFSMPSADIYGNQLNPPDYYKSPTYPQATGVVSLTGINRATQVAAASFNAADQVAKRWRKGEINGIVPLVYAISLLTTPSEPPDPVFMKRIANTTDSTLYDSSKPTGRSIDTTANNQLQNAFLQIASEILRLNK
ncbi:MAG TPA: VWA domain-containing protein [Bryobacteraceae bacterium]|nr:VWA domain-containing protein [Bryobacteraceae bacterium]